MLHYNADCSLSADDVETDRVAGFEAHVPAALCTCHQSTGAVPVPAARSNLRDKTSRKRHSDPVFTDIKIRLTQMRMGQLLLHAFQNLCHRLEPR